MLFRVYVTGDCVGVCLIWKRRKEKEIGGGWEWRGGRGESSLEYLAWLRKESCQKKCKAKPGANGMRSNPFAESDLPSVNPILGKSSWNNMFWVSAFAATGDAAFQPNLPLIFDCLHSYFLLNQISFLSLPLDTKKMFTINRTLCDFLSES